MVIEYIDEESIKQEEVKKQARKDSLREDIILGEEYARLKDVSGYKRLEKEILERTNHLSRRLLQADTEKEMFKIQGELLGIQSVLNIVETGVEMAEEARNILEEENNGTQA